MDGVEYMSLVEKAYTRWMEKQDEWVWVKGKYRFSNSGSCLKQMLYSAEYDDREHEYQKKSLFRLGNLVDHDFKAAMLDYFMNNPGQTKDLMLLQDYQVELVQYNFMGELDEAVLNFKTGVGFLNDYKTINTWHGKHKKVFSKTEAPIISRGYGMQAAGYTLALNVEYPEINFNFGNYFYDKNDSKQNLVGISHIWKDEFKKYATELNKTAEQYSWNELKPGDYGVPYEPEWQCSETYCPVMKAGKCPGIPKKKKK